MKKLFFVLGLLCSIAASAQIKTTKVSSLARRTTQADSASVMVYYQGTSLQMYLIDVAKSVGNIAFDTTDKFIAYQTAINQRLKVSDTAAMFAAHPGGVFDTTGKLNDYQTAINSKAPLASPTFTTKLSLSTSIATPTGSQMAGYTNNSILRSELLDNGNQKWYLYNSGGGEVGSIQYATPNANPGFVFYNASGTGRSQVRQSGTTGGITIGSVTGSGVPGNDFNFTTNGSLLIGTTTDISSSILTLNTTSKGVLLPRMTSTQRAAISSPGKGLQLYDSTINRPSWYDGTSWHFPADSVTSLSALHDTADAHWTAIQGKVDKVTGKQLSTHDYRDADSTKLSGIASGATNVTNTNELTNGAGFLVPSDSAIKYVTPTQLEAGLSEKLDASDTAIFDTAAMLNPYKSAIDVKVSYGDSATASEILNATTTNFAGNSFFDLSPNWTSPVLQFKALTGLRTNNLGVTGNTSTQIKTRFDALSGSGTYSQGWVFEMGRNDATQGGYTTGVANTIKSNLAAMVAALGHSRYLILGMVPSSTETTGSTGGNWIATLNSDLSTLYGSHYIDVMPAFKAATSGTTNDNADTASGLPPRSLMYTDRIHPNTAGMTIEATQIANHLDVLIPNRNKYVTVGALGSVLQQGQSTFSLGVGGALTIGDFNAIKVPDQIPFLNTIIVGSGAKGLTHTSGTDGQGNTVVGMQAGNALTTGSGNTLFGNYAGYNMTTGTSLTAIGESAGLGNTSGVNNVFVGKNAGRNTTTGSTNIFMGASSGQGNTTGLQNVILGLNSGFANTAGNSNVAIGVSSSQNLTGGSNNTAIGTQALKGTSNSTSNNTSLGANSGMSVTTGGSNTLVGFQAGDAITSGNKNVVVAYDGDVASATGSNQVNIGNLIWGTNASGTGTTPAGQVGIGTNAPAASALLDLTSTTQGALLPRMTKTQRDAISSPATGLAIYQTDNTPGLRVYNGTNWMKYTETAD